jgi:integral membrane sensor domain MASE1
VRVAARGVAVTLVYFVTAWLGLSLAAGVSSTITAIWLPSGIALGSVLVWGRLMLPFVFVAAFAVNLATGEAVPLAAFAIGIGNTGEALVTATLLASFGGQSHGSAPNLLSLATAAGIGCAIAATVGSGALLATDALDPSEFAAAWGLWWTGDFAGIFLVVPMLALAVTVDWD